MEITREVSFRYRAGSDASSGVRVFADHEVSGREGRGDRGERGERVERVGRVERVE